MKYSVLFVIDNIIQYDRLKKSINNKKSLKDITFEFRHSFINSAIWEHEDFINKDKSIDVKKDAKWIIDHYNLVISVHCFQLFPTELVQSVRCINIHPGYNPVNRGWYPQVFSLIHDLPIGATIHEMDDKLDHGPIIARQLVEKYIWDTSFTLYNRILEAEIKLWNENIERIIFNDYSTVLPENEGNIFLKRDFKRLCKIDMEKKGTFREFYNQLRALSHAHYRNTYFLDDKTGKKIYLQLKISYNE